jgi:hypothetical protein
MYTSDPLPPVADDPAPEDELPGPVPVPEDELDDGALA